MQTRKQLLSTMLLAAGDFTSRGLTDTMSICRKHELEENMLMNLQKKTWTHGLTLKYVSL